MRSAKEGQYIGSSVAVGSQSIMNNNIYYVGAHHNSIPLQLARPNTNRGSPSAYLSRRGRQIEENPTEGKNTLSNRNKTRCGNNTNNTNNTSKSTSCSKTERSRYMQSLQNLRKLSPVYRRNNIVFRHVFGGRDRRNARQEQGQEEREGDVKGIEQQDNGEVKEDVDERSKISSAFDVQPMKQKGLRFDAVEKIRFRKVEQPRLKENRVHWKLKPDMNGPRNYSNTHSARPNIRKTEKRETPLPQNHPHKTSSSPFAPQEQQSQQTPSQSDFPQTNFYYRLQPSHLYFICTRCYQIHPSILYKTHPNDCQIPLRKTEFNQKWTQLVSFLVELESEKENNWLFRLTDRMKKYGKEGSKEDGVLYSEQLGGILGMKGQIELGEVSEEDLFWLIQSIGDLIETQSLDLSEKEFWKLCT